MALALFACLVLAPASLHAQSYPFPGSDRQAPVLCKACKGTNAAGEPNAEKPTWPYSQPIVRFVGRIVDSSSTVSVQNDGIRTLRAGRIRVAKTQRGSAPARAYIQLGSAVAAYNLSTFFTTALSAPMVAANHIPTGQLFQVYKGRTPFETFAPFDEFLYAEGRGAGWSTVIIDGQDRLEPPDSAPVDCTITADPVALLLVGSRRVSQWAAITLGLVEAGGRRPDLALGFNDLFLFP